MKYRVILLLILMTSLSNAQEIADHVFWVYFTDKDGTGYQIDNPGEFLTERSISRRAWQGLGIDHRDLPVNRDYLQQLKNLGAEVRHVSRWLNGVAMINADSLLFVRVLEKTFTDTLAWSPPSNELYFPPKKGGERFSPPLDTPPDFSYGIAREQVTQLKTDQLHQMGYTGKGVWIVIWTSKSSETWAKS